MVEGFAKDLVAVIRKAEEEEEPVSGKEIVRLIGRWKKAFRSINNALPILSAHLGKMDKDVFESYVRRTTLAEKYESEEGRDL